MASLVFIILSLGLGTLAPVGYLQAWLRKKIFFSVSIFIKLVNDLRKQNSLNSEYNKFGIVDYELFFLMSGAFLVVRLFYCNNIVCTGYANAALLSRISAPVVISSTV